MEVVGEMEWMTETNRDGKVVPTGASFIQCISDRNKTNIMHMPKM